MKSRAILFLLAFLVWALLNWVPDWQHLLLGVFACIFVSYMAGGLFVKRPHLFTPLEKSSHEIGGKDSLTGFTHPPRYLWFLYYVPVFIWECLKANIDVAYRVIHPDLPIRPGIVKVKITLTSDTALTFLANSITLTPGTLSVDIDKENGFLYVHWIDVKDKDVEKATKLIAEKFENILKRIFE